MLASEFVTIRGDLTSASEPIRYIHMTDLVDQMFPPVHRNVAGEYTDFNFWRAPMAEFDLPDLEPTPASPALSARSDSSRLSRLRNFSLVGRASTTSLADKSKAASAAVEAKITGTPAQNIRHQRQSSPLASPVLGANEFNGSDTSSPYGSYRRDRRLSMPGSIDEPLLEDEGFGDDDVPDFRHSDSPAEEDEGSVDQDGEDDDGGDDEDPEAAFDDDLLAAGEMDDIPFL